MLSQEKVQEKISSLTSEQLAEIMLSAQGLLSNELEASSNPCPKTAKLGVDPGTLERVVLGTRNELLNLD